MAVLQKGGFQEGDNLQMEKNGCGVTETPSLGSDWSCREGNDAKEEKGCETPLRAPSGNHDKSFG